MTRSVLATSASSAKSEHNFSEVGNHVTKKCNGLKPKMVDTIKMIRSNKDLKRNHTCIHRYIVHVNHGNDKIKFELIIGFALCTRR